MKGRIATTIRPFNSAILQHSRCRPLTDHMHAGLAVIRRLMEAPQTNRG